MHKTVNNTSKFSKYIFSLEKEKFNSFIIKFSFINIKANIMKNKIPNLIFGLTENLSSITPIKKIIKLVKRNEIRFLKPGNRGFVCT